MTMRDQHSTRGVPRQPLIAESERQDPLSRLYDHNLERATIAGCLYDPGLFATLSLTPQDFHNSHCATVWAFCQERALQGKPVDTMLFVGELVDTEIIPGSEYAAIMSTESTPGMAEAYADRVADLAEQRRWMAAMQAVARAIDGGENWRERAGAVLGELAAARRRKHQTSWAADALLTAVFPAPRWAVPDLIPVGLTLLAGRPKIGKSWLVLQLAQAVGAGGKAIGRAVEPGAVLYLALEDSPRRLKTRLEAQHAPNGMPITFHTDWRGLLDGGLEDLRAEIERGHESGAPYRLIVIDTLGRLLAGLDQRNTGDVTQSYGKLQGLAQAADVAIVGVEHHRKGAGQTWGDVISDIMESTSKPGAADAVIGLYRERGKSEATLKATGRELEDCELALTWDQELACWQYAGLADDVRADSEKGRVMDSIRTLGEIGELATTSRIALDTDMPASNVSRALAKLLETGKVRKAARQGKEQPYELL